MSDNEHYARRFLSRPTRTDGTVEVAHVWGDHVMAELALDPRRRRLTVGPDAANDIVLEHPALPGRRFELVHRAEGGAATVQLTPAMRGDVYIDTTRYDIDEMLAQLQSGALPLTPTTRVRLRLGSSTLYVHQGTRPSLVLPGGRLERRLLAFVVASALAHVVALLLVFLVPERAETLDIDGLALSANLAAIEQVNAEPQPFERPAVIDESERDAAEDASVAARSRGDEGRSGVESEPRENRRSAVRGDDETDRVTLAPRDAQELARERGALSILQRPEGPRSLFGEQPRGFDDVTAWGNTSGPFVGQAFGQRGLGDIGPGPSAGGDHPNGIGIGPIQLRGLYSPDRDDDLLESMRQQMPERPRQREVVPGEPEIGGHLDRALIQRVIREHRREIRDCYQRAYQRNPDLSGRIMVSFTIDPSGAVARVSISESDLDSSAVHECVMGRIRRFVFPEPSEPGLVHVNYPFLFTGS